jgi:hypothetical protein
MNATSKGRTETEDYFQLVRAFPLRPIRNRAQYESAGRLLNRLLGRPTGRLTVGEWEYLDALVLLAADYDRKHSRPRSLGYIVTPCARIFRDTDDLPKTTGAFHSRKTKSRFLAKNGKEIVRKILHRK